MQEKPEAATGAKTTYTKMLTQRSSNEAAEGPGNPNKKILGQPSATVKVEENRARDAKANLKTSSRIQAILKPRIKD